MYAQAQVHHPQVDLTSPKSKTVLTTALEAEAAAAAATRRRALEAEAAAAAAARRRAMYAHAEEPMYADAHVSAKQPPLPSTHKSVSIPPPLSSAPVYEKRKITIYFVIYDDQYKATDFTKIMFQANHQSKLFIYNENFAQYKTQNDTKAGGGNGFLRQYRKDNSLKPNEAEDPISKLRVHVNGLGIPTGQLGQKANENMINSNPIDFSKSHQMDYNSYNGLVEASMINIFNFIGFNNITEVYLSSNPYYSGLGLNIFGKEPWSVQNIERINNKFQSMLTALKRHYNLELKSITRSGTNPL
jgi:hypothetical protein